MARGARYTLTFDSGTVRFDAGGRLFVHSRHSVVDPQPIEVDGEAGAAPGDERRAMLHAPERSSRFTGALPLVEELPRGLTFDLRGFHSVDFEDGALVVRWSEELDVPAWLGASAARIGRAGEGLKLWSKSSLPEGFSFLRGSSVAGERPAAPQDRPAPPPSDGDERYDPYWPDTKGAPSRGSGGCLVTGATLVSLAVLTVALLLS